jgi:hypothetical protein
LAGQSDRGFASLSKQIASFGILAVAVVTVDDIPETKFWRETIVEESISERPNAKDPYEARFVFMTIKVARWYTYHLSYQKYQFGYFWRVLQCKILVYFTTIQNSLLSFGIFCGPLLYFPPFWSFVPRKIWQPFSKFSKFS